MKSFKTSLLLCATALLIVVVNACDKKGVAPHISTTGNTNTLTGDPPGAPAKTWQEHWFEHKQLLTRVFYNDTIALYFDKDVDRSVTWPRTYMSQVWNYVKKTYGDFGKEKRLYVVMHTGKYPGGHPSTYFDDSHDYHNVVDVGSAATDAWLGASGNDHDVITHEVGHIVEGASKGVHNSPAFHLWGDSKWNEIFIFDVYKGLKRYSDTARWYNLMVNTVDDFPVAGTHWFRDWFYPIYNQYGGTAVLNKFFQLLADNFPKNGTDYARDMNWGEFIHFWSGAAGVNLKDLATQAFGWPAEWETEFEQAQRDFPNIHY